MRSPESLTELFRERGLKVTPQRQCIFRALDANEQHPTADAVFDLVRSEMPTISLRTVYQTLNDLAAMGEITPIDLGTGSTRFDPNLDDHHHLVCDRCGAVHDIDAPAPGPDLLPTAAEALGFRISRTDIVFRGLCARCAPSSPTAPPIDRPTA